MVAHEKQGRDTSPAIRLWQPRTEPRALQQQQHQFQFPPPPATQQQFAQMDRGERLRYLVDLAERESAARAVGNIRIPNQPLTQGNPRHSISFGVFIYSKVGQ
jgi:hypothetical protein